MRRSMMIIMLLILGLGLCGSLLAQVNVTVGEGTTSNGTTGVPTPYGTFYKNFRQQFLYLASEIEDAGGGAGPINSLAFNVENVNTCSPMPNFTIRIKTTTQTALTTTFEDGDYTVVFTENDFLPTDGMNVHQFIAPFAWDGASNLIVDIMTSLIPGAYTQNASVYYSTTAFNSSLRYQNDSTEASTATTGSTGTMRSNVTFNMSGVSITNPPNPAQLVAPANGSTLNTPVANLSWGSGGGLPTGYKLYLGTTNPPAFVEDLGLVTTYEANDLEFETLYYWQIVPYNAIGDAVDCPVWSFTTMPNPIVSNFPWTVDFGTTSADWMPAYWTQFTGLYPSTETGTQWFHDDWLNDSASGNKAAKINIYGSTRNGWLVTPPINLPGGDFQLSFDAALMVWNGTTAPTTTQEDDRFMIIMSDSADMSNPTILREWNNTGSEYVFNNIPHDGQTYSISLAGISGIKYFAFYGESTVTGNGDNDLMVDNVSITGGGATENPIFSITPASHNFGELEVNETANISFSISNAGTGSLGIQSITIAGSEMISLANLPTLPTALNAGQTASFTVNYAPTTAGTHTATVTVTDNINRVAHNVSISGSAVSGGTEDLDPPTNLAANVSGNDVHLSWTAPGDTPPPPPDGFSDDFESYENFTLAFDPWVLVDVDMSATYGMTNISWPNAYAAMAYMIFNPSATTPPVTDLVPHSGAKMAASFASTSAVNNDWMISPMISVENGHFFNFWAKSYTAQYGLERFKVGVSTGGTAPANFTMISGASYVQAPVEWTQFSYDLSAYAGQDIRVAIQCVSDDAFIFLVDDVSVGAMPVRFDAPVAVANTIGTATRNVGTPVPAPAQRSVTRDLLGYKVYRDGVLINTIANPATTMFDDMDLEEGSYSYTVTAYYDGGESEPAGPVSATITNLIPPIDLAATVEGNDVTLNWTSPVPPLEGEWITWCNVDALGNSIGTNAAAEFDVAHMFDATDLAAHQGGSIAQIKFVPAHQACVYTVKVWTGGTATAPGTLVYSAVHENFSINEWNLHVLTTPVPIPADRLWIGFGVNTQGGYPAGCDDGPVLEGKGNIMNFGGWSTLTQLNPALTYNWSIQGFVANGTALKNVTPKPIVEAPKSTPTGTLAVNRFEPTRNRALLGYKVYRDGTQIANISDPEITTYMDWDLPNADYVYGVTAVYAAGESEPATVNVTVNMQLAPVLLGDSFENHPDFALLFAPWTLLDQDLSETYGFTGIQFPGSGGPMAYMVFNPTTTTPPVDGLTAQDGTKMLASFAAVNPPNNDWLITPRINLGTGSALKFYAKSHTAQYGLERFRVGVSTLATIIPQGFQYITGATHVEAPTNWTEYIYDLSNYDGQSVYITIRCVSNDAFVFYVDNVSVHSVGGSVSNDDISAPVMMTELKGNYPNPFNPETTIRYSVREASPVNIEIYNLKGQLVKTLVSESKAAGEHSVIWKGTDNNNRPVSSGVYFYKMNAGKYSSTKKMIMMK